MIMLKAVLTVIGGVLSHMIFDPIIKALKMRENTDFSVRAAIGIMLAIPFVVMFRRNIFKEPEEATRDFQAMCTGFMMFGAGAMGGRVYDVIKKQRP